jgi:hypothetical protein
MEGARPNAAAEEKDESGARCQSCGRTEDPSLPIHARCDRVAVRSRWTARWRVGRSRRRARTGVVRPPMHGTEADRAG